MSGLYLLTPGQTSGPRVIKRKGAPSRPSGSAADTSSRQRRGEWYCQAIWAQQVNV
jgi:hypothetical protein